MPARYVAFAAVSRCAVAKLRARNPVVVVVTRAAAVTVVAASAHPFAVKPVGAGAGNLAAVVQKRVGSTAVEPTQFAVPPTVIAVAALIGAFVALAVAQPFTAFVSVVRFVALSAVGRVVAAAGNADAAVGVEQRGAINAVGL